jgi:hypothetical protein
MLCALILLDVAFEFCFKSISFSAIRLLIEESSMMLDPVSGLNCHRVDLRYRALTRSLA